MNLKKELKKIKPLLKIYRLLQQLLVKKKKQRIQRWEIKEKKDAITFLSERINDLNIGNNKKSLIVGDGNFTQSQICNILKRHKIEFVTISLDDFINKTYLNYIDSVNCIVATYHTTKELHIIGRLCIERVELTNIAFEYISISNDEYFVFQKYDHFDSTSFISPLFADEINYFKIYEDSLKLFELKCEIRDYLDLTQLVKNLAERKIAGDIAEFGSYKGHSGYLIAKLIENFKLKNRIYLFDTFENFPEEEYGIDSFWSKTHYVDYVDVKKKFEDIKNVSLVKGDFTKTLNETNIDKLALIYIDCDSYRATSYILNNLYEEKLVKGGVVIFEDYGHPALLGNRLAFHSFFDKKENCISFFSGFSGFNFVVKL